MLSNSMTMDKLEKQNVSNQNDRDIFERMKAGEPIRLDDPEYFKVQEVVNRTIELSAQLNTSTDVDQIRKRLSEIIGTTMDESTTVFAPFYTNFGRFIQNRQKCIYQPCLFISGHGWNYHRRRCINWTESQSHNRKSSFRSR